MCVCVCMCCVYKHILTHMSVAYCVIEKENNLVKGDVCVCVCVCVCVSRSVSYCVF